MSHTDTIFTRSARVALTGLALFLAATGTYAQSAGWRPVGNTLRLLGLPSPAGGPVDRIWFTADGRLHLLIDGGRQFATSDWETWTPAAEPVPDRPATAAFERLEDGTPMIRAATPSGRTYAGGAQVYVSSDEGRTWENLTGWHGESLLGARVRDIAPDPGTDGRVAVATETGIWLSHDAGRTWIGLNEGLPNLPVRALIELPENGRHLRVAVRAGESTELMEWVPGQRAGWLPAREPDPRLALRARLSARLDTAVTAAATAGDFAYAGADDGRLLSTPDKGETWRTFPAEGSIVEEFWIDTEDPRVALAALRPAGEGRGRILRTLNGGVWWDDLSSNLPAAPVHGLAADRETGVIYAATGAGLFWTASDLRAPSPPTPWLALEGLPAGAAVRDAALDRAGVRLFAAVDGYGIWVAPAPHRALRPATVHTADFGMRPAAPGALLSVFGASARQAAAGGQPAAVLSAESGETQLQIPFDLTGDTLRLALDGGPDALRFDLPLRPAAPAVLTDRDGAPMLIEADTGMPLDAANPGRPRMTVQILATGLGRVAPDWPAGLPAPLEAPPSVRAPVRVLLDGVDLEVLGATLAPGYIGYYLVEARLPEFVDSGLGALVIDVAGNVSPPAGIHLDQ